MSKPVLTHTAGYIGGRLQAEVSLDTASDLSDGYSVDLRSS